MINDLYIKLKDLKIELRIINGDLEVSAPKNVLNDGIIDEIKTNKVDLISFIQNYHTSKIKQYNIPAIEKMEYYPLSSAQYRMWIMSRFEEANAAYNSPGVYVFDGEIDMIALNQALNILIQRHEILRTVFKFSNEGSVIQVVIPENEFQFKPEIIDCSKSENIEATIKQLIESEFIRPFDLGKGPLMRINTYKISSDKSVLMYILHHVICDGWSKQVLINELLYVYNSICKKQEIKLNTLKIQYKDYAVWQQKMLQNGGFDIQRKYWLEQLSGDLPILQIPSNKVRPHIKTYNGKKIYRQINSEITSRLRQFSKNNHGTLFMGILSVINVLLYKYSGQKDIIVGTSVAGRSHVDLENQIGFYTNLLALRSRFSEEINFLSMYNNTRKMLLEAYQHQLYPYDTLVGELEMVKDPGRNPLFDIMVVLQAGGDIDVKKTVVPDQMKISNYGNAETATSIFDLTFDFSESISGLQFVLEYNTDVYDFQIANSLCDHFDKLILNLLDFPELSIDEIEMVNESEKQKILSFNNTETQYPRNNNIVEVFKAQVSLTPTNSAIVFQNTMVTYKELDHRSDIIASVLQNEYGIKKGDLVGIQLEKSELVIVLILGILKCGAAYVPIETAFPAERVKYIAFECQLKLLIDADKLIGLEQKILTDKSDFINLKIFATDFAYVMYTSGSTGKPKGVIVPHRAIIRLVKNTNYIDLSEKSVLLSTGSMSFDATTFEYWSMLLNGGCLVLAKNEQIINTNSLKELIKTQHVNTMWFTAGFLNQVIEADLEVFASLKMIIAGGDKLSPKHIGILRLRYPELKIVNGYGPTENTTFSLFKKIDKVDNSIPIGRPISNSTVYILDSKLHIVPVGMMGEIYLSGDGLSFGYIENKQLTNEKFIPNPFEKDGVMYRTGDFGRWNLDGDVEFIGRVDDQVKIRGYRIEINEVEKVIKEHTSADVIVTVNQENEEKFLIAYLKGINESVLEVLKDKVRQYLPSYMIPAFFIIVEKFPLSANGKVDKKSLPLPYDGMAKKADYEAPQDDLEKCLVKLWSEVLDVRESIIGILDNFFDLGGDSFKIIKLSLLINQELKKNIDVSLLFEFPSVKTFCDHIKNEKSEKEEDIDTEGLIHDLEKFDIE